MVFSHSFLYRKLYSLVVLTRCVHLFLTHQLVVRKYRTHVFSMKYFIYRQRKRMTRCTHDIHLPLFDNYLVF